VAESAATDMIGDVCVDDRESAIMLRSVMVARPISPDKSACVPGSDDRVGQEKRTLRL
jgi:hypothetical protein